MGRLNLLIGEHFPWLLDLITPVLVPKLFDQSRPRTTDSTLFESSEAGRERSGVERPRRISFYTVGELHPRATAGLALGMLAGAVLLLGRHRQARSLGGTTT